LTLGAAAASTFTVGGAGGAGASPLSDQQAQAAALEAQINANAVKLDSLNEQVKGAQYQLDQADATIADAQFRIDAARTETERLQQLVQHRAVAMYQGAATGAETGLFDVDPIELASSQKYTAAASGQNNTLVDRLNEARTVLNARQRDAQRAKSAAENQKAQLQTAEASFQATNGQYQALLGRVKGNIATLVAQEQAARAAREAPRSTGTGTGGGGGGGGGVAFDPGRVPPASGSGGVAVSFAQQQLGKPYCYGGAGPACYDCSGLTMSAWGAAGVGLPHNSEAQSGMLPHVPLHAMAPGDIAYTYGHVGIYVGGGAVIHAPHTGDVVRYIDVGYFDYGLRP
jgi:cell wall-associated NlpC family hydrolase